MKDILKKHGIKIGAALVVLVLIITLSANFLGSRRSFLESVLSFVTSPFEKGAAKVARGLEKIYDQMYRYDTLKAENDELKRRVAELEDQTRGYAAAISENDRLRTLLGLVTLKPDLELCSAPITAWTASNWACAFTISVSSGSDVKAGDCVIDEYGNLLGRVSSVGGATATVCCIIDPTFEAGGLVEGSDAPGVIGGDFSLMQSGLARLSYLSPDADILNGDSVLTSGKGGTVPRGLTVGTIRSVSEESSGLSRSAVITPYADLGSLSEVYVITAFEVGE